MTQEEKELIYKDLCARLPYGVIVQQSAKYPKGHSMHNVADKWDTEPHDFKIIGVEGTNTLITDKRKEERTYAKGIVSSPITISIHNGFTGQVVKPYLRPMSSMTEEEKKEYHRQADIDLGRTAESLREQLETGTLSTENRYTPQYCHIDWLNAHHFDYRGLIPTGLANEAPEGMYKS